MIPMTCPGCGRRGNVPPDRLNTRMHCKKCDAVFFMDKTGTIVLGDPNVIMAKAKKEEERQKQAAKKGGGWGAGKPKAKGKAGKKAQEQEIQGFADLLKRIPTKALVALGVVVLVGVLFGAGFRLPKLWKSAPKTVDLIAAEIVDGWVDNKLAVIQKYSLPGTEEAVKKWHDEFRSKFEFKGPQNPKMNDTVDPVINGVVEEEGGQVAIVNLYYLSADTPAGVKEEKALIKEGKRSQLKGEREAGYKFGGNFTLPMFFVPVEDTFKLDPAKSLEIALPKAKEDPKKKKR